MNYPKSVKVVEVGPRDGLQNEKKIISVEDKIEYINRLSDSGLKHIEVTSFVNPKSIPQLADAEEVFSKIKKRNDVNYYALVPNLKGLERAIKSGVKNISIFTASSDTFNQKNINMTIDESILNYSEVVKNAHESKMSVRAYISTAFYCPYEGKVDKNKTLEVCLKLMDLNIDELSVGDTIGKANSEDVREVIQCLSDKIPKENIALHFHDTYGNAAKNVMAGLEFGISIYDSSCGGIGGCPYAPGASGNVSTESLVRMLKDLNIETGVSLDKLAEASKFIGSKLKI